jgi:hypothetical protein
MGARFVADPVPLGVPERTRFERDDAKPGPREALHEHAARGADADDAVVDLFPGRKPAHREVELLDGTEPDQCVPPCPGAPWCSEDPATGSNTSESDPGGARHS